MLTRLRGSYDVGEGIGYRDGFTSLETFWGYNRVENFIGFLDAIGHIFDNGKIAANLGLGARFNVPSLSTMFGINGFYDYRRTNRFHYDQVGAGLEILSKYFDIRANGYLPFGKKSHFLRNKFDRFVGFDVAFDEITEEVLRGVDGELGFNLVNLGPFRFYAAGGAYFYERKDCITHLGGQGRLQVAAWQRFFAQVSITGDSLYDTRVQGQFALDVPLYSLKPRKPISYPQLKRNLYTSLNAYLTQPVIRHPIIPVCKQEKARLLSEVATNPITGGPYFFMHLRNDAPPYGNGSISRPFNSLDDYEASAPLGAILMFNPGNGTTQNNADGVTLKFGQQLWGTGVEHFIRRNNERVLIVIPPITPGRNPKMTNIAGDAITLARATHVAGIDIESPSGRGIFGSNVRGVDLNRNSVNTPGGNGIELTHSGTFSGTNLIVDNTVIGPSGGNGIYIETNDTSNVTSTVFRNTVQQNQEGIFFLAADSSTVNISVVQNTVSNSSQCNIANDQSSTGTINANVLANHASSAGSNGNDANIYFLGFLGAPQPTINCNIIDNIVDNSQRNAFSGIGVEADSATIVAVIKNNQVTGTFRQGPGGAYTSRAEDNNASVQINMEGNIAVNDQFTFGTDFGIQCIRLNNNQGSAFVIDRTGGTVQVESSTFDTYNPEQGVEQTNQGPFTFSGSIDFVAPNTCDVDE